MFFTKSLYGLTLKHLYMICQTSMTVDILWFSLNFILTTLFSKHGWNLKCKLRVDIGYTLYISRLDSLKISNVNSNKFWDITESLHKATISTPKREQRIFWFEEIPFLETGLDWFPYPWGYRLGKIQ